MSCGLGGMLVGKVAALPCGVIWPPKPSAEEAAPQQLMQDWPGLPVVSLGSRTGAQASQHCMLLGFLQTLTPVVRTSGHGELVFGEGNRSIVNVLLNYANMQQLTLIALINST